MNDHELAEMLIGLKSIGYTQEMLDDVLNQVLRTQEVAKPQRPVWAKREDFVRAYLRMKDTPESLAAAERQKVRRQYSDARNEHAFLLRCEGMKFEEIGRRLGVTGSFARLMAEKAIRKLNTAMRRTKLRFEACH